ncbi:hypothetical protein QO009_003308 [Brevibacillus aydinogluensis]|jgi:hypothetical protein|uniref:hypothetical protein n=1 Tax=Brevibacillus aydinogluensis TaxID=927786 RepID=UPI0028931880|nr:hypothetical protein [Brevibacillus aydinogluensis]MDT3417413.1 hypothetical protein [Brevibacillus aydinogluensis]
MFSIEDCQVIQSSLDNLLSLKLLHDAGYRVSDMGYWVTDYAFENMGGDIFMKATERLFGACAEEEKEDGSYDIRKFIVLCPDIEELLGMFTKEWVESQLQWNQRVVCDWTGAEMIIELKKMGFIIEIHESPSYFNQFIQELIQIRKLLDRLLVYAQYLKGNRGARYAAFYCEV